MHTYNRCLLINKTKGYIVLLFKDLTEDDILAETRKIRKLSHTNYDSFVLYFSGHGDQNVILGHDLGHVEIADIIEMFEPKRCSSLQRKPKVSRNQSYVWCFFFNMNRCNLKDEQKIDCKLHKVILNVFTFSCCRDLLTLFTPLSFVFYGLLLLSFVIHVF